MADIIYKNEDDLLKRRHRSSALVELPSGAWQKRPLTGVATVTAAEQSAPSVLSPPAVATTATMPAGGVSGLRQRRSRGEGGGAATTGKPSQPEVLSRFVTPTFRPKRTFPISGAEEKQ